MIIDVEKKTIRQIDVDEYEAFKILCSKLDMDCVLDEDTDFIVTKDGFDSNTVCDLHDGVYNIYDDRGDLFIALRSVAIELFPDLALKIVLMQRLCGDHCTDRELMYNGLRKERTLKVE